MTPQEKLIAISGYLPYGLRVTTYKKSYKNIPIGVLNYYNAEDRDCISFTADEGYYLCNIEETIPILFPIESLYKEIRVKSYNNGEPFIPIVELAKVYSDTVHVEKISGCVSNYSYFKCWFDDGFEELIISDKLDAWYRSYFDKNQPNTGRNIINQLRTFDLLNSWYIDYRCLIEQGESISVLDINPNLYAE